MKKRMILFLVCLALLTLCSIADDPHGIVTVEIPVMTWNVADMHWLGGCGLCDKSADRYMANFVRIMDSKLVAIQEDWCWHLFDELKNDYQYSTHPPFLPEFFVDGLSVFSDFECYSFQHVPWDDCFGLLTNNYDCLTSKGFVFNRIRVPVSEHSYFYVDFYVLHTDAGRDFKDRYARMENMWQLGKFIEQYSNGYPVIVAGDFNLDYFDDANLNNDRKVLSDFTTKLGLSIANDLTKVTEIDTDTRKWELFDYILFRGTDKISLTQNGIGQVLSTDSSGVDTMDGSGSDHYPVFASFNYSVNLDNYPDLQVTDIQYYANDNGSADITVTIKNFGPAAIPADKTITLDCFLPENRRLDKTYIHQSLQNGESCSINYYVEDFDPGAAPFYITAIVDLNGEIQENNEDNNSLRKKIDLSLTDLQVTGLSFIPASPVSGRSLEIVATVKNTGNTATPAGVPVNVSAWIDNSPLGTFTVKDAGGNNKQLSPGESYTEKVSGIWTALAGSHTFRAAADPDGLIAETDEANNSFSLTYTIPNAFTITVSAGAGGTITPSVNVVVAQGGSQIFTITANSGYAIQDVKVNGVSKGAISTYTFTNVQANQAIEATFSSIPLIVITAPKTTDWVESNSRVPFSITWSFSPALQGKTVSIYLLNDAQQWLATLATNIPIGNSGLGWWVAQKLNDGGYYIKIVTSDSQVSALSERFTIHFRFDVTDPLGGGWVQANAWACVKWRYASTLAGKVLTINVLDDYGNLVYTVGRNVPVESNQYCFWLNDCQDGWYSYEIVINDGKNPAYSEKFHIFR